MEIIKEMNDVALNNSPFISKFIIKKTSQFYKIFKLIFTMSDNVDSK